MSLRKWRKRTINLLRPKSIIYSIPARRENSSTAPTTTAATARTTPTTTGVQTTKSWQSENRPKKLGIRYRQSVSRI